MSKKKASAQKSRKPKKCPVCGGSGRGSQETCQECEGSGKARTPAELRKEQKTIREEAKKYRAAAKTNPSTHTGDHGEQSSCDDTGWRDGKSCLGYHEE